MKHITSALLAMTTVPHDEDDFANWLELTDAIQFLHENAEDNEFVLYAQASHVYVHAVLVPEELVDPPDFDDIMSWDCHPTDSWTTASTLSEPPTVSIEPPLSHDRSKFLGILAARRHLATTAWPPYLTGKQ